MRMPAIRKAVDEREAVNCRCCCAVLCFLQVLRVEAGLLSTGLGDVIGVSSLLLGLVLQELMLGHAAACTVLALEPVGGKKHMVSEANKQ